LGWRQLQSRFQAIDVSHDLLVQFDERSARLTEAPIVIGPLAKVGEFAGRQGAQASFPVLGPGNHGGGMKGSLCGGAVTGGLAATGAKVIDGTFDELSQGEHGIELRLVIGAQLLEGLAQTAGAFCCSRRGRFLFMLYIIKP
jgi:hypothetical protein